jgi:alpha-beta hydrolase superfamily lysophospholipase
MLISKYMNTSNLIGFIAIISTLCMTAACTHQNIRTPSAAVNDLVETINYSPLNVQIRAGYLMEKNNFKGCVLYLQGLADSMMNHKPYFSALNQAGFRVIYFDYMGQGGSGGSMNDSRVQVELPPNATDAMLRRYEEKDKYFEIPTLADFIWTRYKNIRNDMGRSCNDSKKFIIGWSTGGLSAYRMANEKRADAVVLIAPGIHPKILVGESADQWDKLFTFRQVITESTLTRNKFVNEVNPHVDPINPVSPMRVPQFAFNLLGVSMSSQHWKIDPSVQGLVFLSGAEDTYVDRDKTIKTLTSNASHFSVFSYNGALHELDNEIPAVAAEVQLRTIQFFDSIVDSENETN